MDESRATPTSARSSCCAATGSAVTDTPAEGATYTVGNTIGSSTVACVVTRADGEVHRHGADQRDGVLLQGLRRDANGNYATGVVPTGSPATPVAPLLTFTAERETVGNSTARHRHHVHHNLHEHGFGWRAGHRDQQSDSRQYRFQTRLRQRKTLGTTGLTAAVTYSSDGGTVWTYTPVSGAGGAPAGYDRLVTNIRWTLTGALSQTAPNNSGTASAIVRIR